MATFKDFVNNLTKPTKVNSPLKGGNANSSSFLTPLNNTLNSKPTTPVVNQSFDTPKIVTPAGATSPVQTKITPPTAPSTISSTPKDQFINNLSSSGNSIPTTNSNTTVNTKSTQNTTPVNNPHNDYLDYLKGQFKNQDELRTKADTEEKYYNDIQARNRRAELDAIAEQEKERYAPGGLKAGADMKINEIGRKATLESAYGALDESAALASANRADKKYNDAISAGKSVYEAELAKQKENKKEGFSLSKDQTRYEYNSTTGQYEKIGGGSATQETTTYQEGANNVVDSYVKGIKNSTLKISDVPDQYKDLVAQGLNTKTSQISDSGKEVLGIVDTLLANPELSRISGTIDQALGGFINGDAKLAKNYYNQLVGILKLDNRQKLKGSGAISDFEFKVLGQAATALGRNLSDEDFKNELQKLKDKLSGNAPIPTTPTNGDVWKDPEGTEFEFKNGYWEETNSQPFNSVGKTTASNIPQKNKNPGNVKQGGLADKLAIGVDKQGHLMFPDEQTGFKAMKMDLEAKINGNSRYLPANPTIAQLGKVYAEDPNWGKSVASILGVSPTTNTKMIPINNLVQAIARQEGYYV